MKNIKFLLLFLIPLFFVGCITEEERIIRQDTKLALSHFVNEDFILVHKEEIKDTEGTVRVWRIHLINSPLDSVYVGEIRSFVQSPEPEGCGCNGDFYITNELWYNKDVGATLHFDNIRKNRFFLLAKINLSDYNEAQGLTLNTETITLDGELEESPDLGYGTETTETSDLDYTERLSLERKAEELQEELNKINELLK